MLTRSGGAPTRALLLVTALLALIGAALLALGLAGPPPTPEDALRTLSSGGTVQVDDDGLSLWSTDAEAFEETVCTADATPLLRPVAPYSITVAGTAYHEVARSPRALLAGSYKVSCTPQQTLSAGPHAERSAPSVLRGPVGVILGAGLLGLALLLGAVALVLHRRQKRLEAWRVPAHRLDPSLRAADEADEPAQGGGPAEGAPPSDDTPALDDAPTRDGEHPDGVAAADESRRAGRLRREEARRGRRRGLGRSLGRGRNGDRGATDAG